MNFKFIILFFLQFPLLSYSKLNVVTTTTDVQWLVEKIGGNKVKVVSLLNGSEDPHYVDAMPHFISKVANADAFCFVGLDLEVGWAPKVLAKSGNKSVQQGGKGFCELGKTVKALNVPKGNIDRSQGDVHAMGNPHFHLGPNAFLEGGLSVLASLSQLDPSRSTYYQSNYEKLKLDFTKLKEKVSKILLPMKEINLMEYHREFSYFFKEFNLKSVGAIEAVPGVPPSAGTLARAAINAKNSNVKLAIASRTSPQNLTKKFSEMSHIPVVRTPISILKDKKSKVSNYEELLVFIATSMVEALEKHGTK